MFVTFEGPEGSGKSTQAHLLASYLRERGAQVMLTREPGGTPLGDRLRDLLLEQTGIALNARAQVLLFSAARAQLVADRIRPALAEGRWVICDRYVDSTIAYQVYGCGLALHEVETVVGFATGGLMPRLTVLLDLPPEAGLRRKGPEGGVDRFEGEDLAFHRRVREGYLTLARREPERWLVLDATLPVAEIAQRIRERVDHLSSS